MSGVLQCLGCRDFLPTDDFYVDRHSGRGRVTKCKPCYRQAVRDRRIANPEHTRALQRRSQYGVSVEDQRESWERQAGVCPICQLPLPDNTKFVHVDHDHDTGEFRGWLCRGCNVSLGHYEKWYVRYRDSVERYLSTHWRDR